MESGISTRRRAISSDYELATLLIELNEAARSTSRTARVLQGGNKLQSDYEHRRVLDAVVKRTGQPRMLLDVLTSARHRL